MRRQRVLNDGQEILIYDLPRVDAAAIDALEAELARGKFEAIAVELDPLRQAWLEHRDDPDDLNVLDIFRAGQGARLGSYLALRILQKRLGSFDDQEPGDEICAAMAFARRHDLPLYLVDRDVEHTGLRAWRQASRWQRLKLGLVFATGPFRRVRPREDAEDEQALRARIARLRRSMPTVATNFLDERERYMAAGLADLPEKRVAFVGNTAHASPIAAHLSDGPPAADERQRLDEVPPKTTLSKLLPWLISAAIALLFVAGFVFGDLATLKSMALTWALTNMAFTAIFSIAALAHPLTVLAAGLSSPIVSLNPAMGAGLVGAAVQLFLVPPGLAEVEHLGDHILSLRGWWQNRLARLALVFVFANAGSTVGTLVAIAILPGLMPG